MAAPSNSRRNLLAGRTLDPALSWQTREPAEDDMANVCLVTMSALVPGSQSTARDTAEFTRLSFGVAILDAIESIDEGRKVLNPNANPEILHGRENKTQ